MTRAIFAVLLLAACTAPRAASDDSPRPGQLGAPQSVSGPVASHPAGPGIGATRGGAPSPSPAVVNVTTSEGAPSPTTSTPGDYSVVILEGLAGWAVPSLGRDYLAMRLPRGTIVTICGPGGCWRHARVNDYGPSKRLHPDRIADVALHHWEDICGVPKSMGLCNATATIEKRGASPTLPPTDEEEDR